MTAKQTRTLAGALLLLGVAGWLGGCCTLGLRSCTVTDAITITGAGTLNSCDGNNHSVTVRIYSLTATDAFAKGDLDVIWADEGKGLGDQKAGLKEITVAPGQPAQEFQLARPKGCVALGVVANFCTQSPGCWNKLINLEKGSSRVLIKLEKVCLTATTQ
jgi:type VI secretion system VasD/TssJ family lipoprotein